MKNFLPFCLMFMAFSADVFSDEALSLKNISDIRAEADVLEREVVLSQEDSGRTPLSAILGLRAAAGEEQWVEAAKYIDSRYLDGAAAELGGPELVRRLAIVWSQQNIIDYSLISDEEKGHLDDGLPSYRDLIGTLKTLDGEIGIYIQRVPDGEGGRVWRISNESIKAVPDLWQELGYPDWVDRLEKYLPKINIWELKSWQLAALIVIGLAAWGLLWLVAWPMKKIRLEEHNQKPYLYFVDNGVRRFLLFKVLAWSVGYLGLSVTAKTLVSSQLFNVLAGVFIGLAFIEVFSSIYVRTAGSSRFSVAIARPLTTTVKIIFCLVMLLMWLKGAGFDIGTLVAGLGIGSLAIALAAQKTLENVFGAFMLYVARPIKPGDFCRFGDTLGTVEEIGLRSTLIRKLDRTLVYVPNSEFSTKSLENYSPIDRRHYYRTIRLDLGCDPAQLKSLVSELLECMRSHERVLEEDLRVCFENIADDAYIIVINAYVDIVPISEFKLLAQELNFIVIELVAAHKLKLALPEQRIRLESQLVSD